MKDPLKGQRHPTLYEQFLASRPDPPAQRLWTMIGPPVTPQRLEGATQPFGFEAIDLAIEEHRCVVGDALMERGWPAVAWSDHPLANVRALIGACDAATRSLLAARFALAFALPSFEETRPERAPRRALEAIVESQRDAALIEQAREALAPSRDVPGPPDDVDWAAEALRLALIGQPSSEADLDGLVDALVGLGRTQLDEPPAISGSVLLYQQARDVRSRREVGQALLPLTFSVMLASTPAPRG